MDLSFFLEQQLINNIIMYARPTYPYIPELHNLQDLWYDNDSYFCELYSNVLILDNILLKKYFKRDYYRARVDYEWKAYNI